MGHSTSLTFEKELIDGYSEKLKKWFNLLNETMPDYFFSSFSSQQVQDLLPALFNLRQNSGIQQIHSGNNIILIYLKSEKNNLVTTAKLMRNHNVVGASIHESKQKIVVDGVPSTLVVEYYQLGDFTMKSVPTMPLKEVKAAYKKLYKTAGKEVDEIYERVNWQVVADLDADRLADRLHHALQVQGEDVMRLNIEKAGKDELRLTMSLANCPSKGFYCKYIECLANNGFHVHRAYLRRVTSQDDEHDLKRMPVSVNTLYLKTDQKSVALNSAKVKQMLTDLPHVKWVSCDDLLHQELVVNNGWSLAQTNLMRAAGEFVHSQLAYIDRHAYSCQEVFRLMALYESLLKDLVTLFEGRFNPVERLSAQAVKRLDKKIRKEIASINTGNHEKDCFLKTVFNCLLNFVESVRKTNFYVEKKTALSFRLDPAFLEYYAGICDRYLDAFPKGTPYGVFYFYRDCGLGFQVRFSSIARGGWRTVIPRNEGNELEKMDAYSFAKDEIFREVFVLAHTQHMKNKDIYEGGSKMICLLNRGEHDFFPFLYEIQRSICRAFLNLINYDQKGILKDKNIVDELGEQEIIEIGPDENMFDVMIKWMGEYSKSVGYALGGGLISGKPDSGINHKLYGVTSYGVHQYLLKTLEEMGVNPTKDAFTVKISGGPFGDVAGNEMKLLLEKKNGRFLFPNLKIVAVTDGPAAAFDPDGLDRDELLSLVHTSGLDAFKPDALKGEGAYIVFNKQELVNGVERYPMVVRQKGKNQTKMISRDEFMKVFQDNLMVNYADIFIPCGGRPSTIDMSNWTMYCPGGAPSSKAIVEGANSFITPDARNKLQEAGVWIIKDASANKCGVITSSYEILSGLMLDVEEFKKCKDKLVSEIVEILRRRARQEADWLFLQFRNTGKKMTDLTEQLSREINQENVLITDYLKEHPQVVSKKTIKEHLPRTLAELDDRLDNIPAQYKEAIVAVELASRIVYGRTKSVAEEIRQVM